MTKKMLAVALMLSFVAVLAGCNKTPTEPDGVTTGDEMVIQPEILPIEDETPAEEIMADEVTPVQEDVATEEESEVEIVAAE